MESGKLHIEDSKTLAKQGVAGERSFDMGMAMASSALMRDRLDSSGLMSESELGITASLLPSTLGVKMFRAQE